MRHPHPILRLTYDQMRDLADFLPSAEPWSCCISRASVLQFFQSFALGTQAFQSPDFANGKHWLDTLYCNRGSDTSVREIAVKGVEFLRRARQYAKRHGLQFEFNPRRGKGSHGRILLGGCITAIKSGNKTLGTGLVHKMLKDLSIDPKEF